MGNGLRTQVGAEAGDAVRAEGHPLHTSLGVAPLVTQWTDLDVQGVRGQPVSQLCVGQPLCVQLDSGVMATEDAEVFLSLVFRDVMETLP